MAARQPPEGESEARVDVMVEACRRYGVDANWLLTGEYDPATHRALAQGPVGPSEVGQLVAERLPSWSLLRPAVTFPA